MFGFGNKNKAKVEVETAKSGGPIKRLRLLVGAGFIIGIIHAVESYFGTDFLPEGLEKETADTILQGFDLVAAYFAWKAVKPAVVQAADAQGSVEVAQAKADAGVK